MTFKTETIQPKHKGQKPIKFKKGALTAQAARAGKSISELCASPPTGLAAKRCAFKRNVLTGGRKKGFRR